jgi:hypothetical protein
VSDAAGEIYEAAVWSEAEDDELDAGASADHLWEPLVVNGQAVESIFRCTSIHGPKEAAASGRVAD